MALQAATVSSLDGVIAMSPWTSLAEIGREHFPAWMVSLFARESYDSVEAAGRIKIPVLVLHGTRDTIIPPSPPSSCAVKTVLPRNSIASIA